jgi:DNA-binding winged helix-turn-helix (wHTH) protein
MNQITIGNDLLEGLDATELPIQKPLTRQDGRAMYFGDYVVCPGARTLRQGSSEVPLGSRAFDLLVVLLRSRGRLVTKDEIVREVWPSTFVDESNLRFQMGVLRKALRAERNRIKTIPGRGYIFVDNDGVSSDMVARRRAPVSAKGTAAERFILIVEPNADDRDAMAALLRALKINVLSFSSVEEVAAFTVGPFSPATI